MYVYDDRVHDTSTSVGTGDFVLAVQPPLGYRTFSAALRGDNTAIQVGDTLPYVIQHKTLNEWEVGVGTYSAANTLTRTTVLRSSNSNAAVNFSSGTKDVAIAQSSSLLVLKDSLGNIVLDNSPGYTSIWDVGPVVQLNTGYGVFGMHAWNETSNSSGAPALYIAKSHSTAKGIHGIVASTECLACIEVGGSDGVHFASGGFIRALVDGTPGVDDMPTRWSFGTRQQGIGNAAERMRIDSYGRVIFGGVAAQAGVGWTPSYQWNSAGDGFGLFAWSASAGNAHLIQYQRSRGATIGTHTAVQDGDALGYIDFAGSDGANFINSAEIAAVVKGTVATNSVPANLIFKTSAAGQQWAVERMRVGAGPLAQVSIGGYAHQYGNLGLEVVTQTRWNYPNVALGSFDNTGGVWDSYGSFIFMRSRGGTVGTHGATASNEVFGEVNAYGNDGTQYKLATEITFQADGTPSAGIVPGKISFQTASAAGTMQSVLVLGSNRQATFYDAVKIQSSDVTAHSRLTTQAGNSAGSNGGIGYWTSKGTVTSPAALAAGSVLWQVYGQGYDGAAWCDTGYIYLSVEGTVSSGVVPSTWDFSTADGAGAVKNRLTIRPYGDVQIGRAVGALATDSTVGFLHIPSCPGTPTGTPASLTTGIVPIIVDTTNNRLYGYYASSWHQLT